MIYADVNYIVIQMMLEVHSIIAISVRSANFSLTFQ